MGTVTAIVSDTHIGSWYGLALHQWNLDTGTYDKEGKPIMKPIFATPSQDWLYNQWCDFWKHAWDIAHEGGHRLIAIHLGDVIDGRHHNSPTALPLIADQEAMATEIMKNVSNMVDQLVFIRGTEAHAGPLASSEIRIAKELGARCTFEAIFDIDGIIIDVAHHGRAGRRAWTSTAAAQASHSIMEAALAGRLLPRYIFRGHNHTIDDSGDKISGIRSISMPAWCMRNEFGYRVSAGSTSDIGGVIIRPDGLLDMTHIRYIGAPDQRNIIKL